MYVCVLFHLHVCVHTICMLVACEGKMRASDVPELELYMVVSHHLGVGNQVQVHRKGSKYS